MLNNLLTTLNLVDGKILVNENNLIFIALHFCKLIDSLLRKHLALVEYNP